MKQKTSMLQYFAPLYILNKLYDEDGLNNPQKYQNDEAFLNELKKLQEQDPDLINEISQAASDDSGIYKSIWDKIETLTNSKDILSAANGAKLSNLKRLRKVKKKKHTKKCKCGCDLIESMEEGGKLVSKCSCGCKGVKSKKKGGSFDKYDLDLLLESGEVDSSSVNKWERKINSRKLGKFRG